MTRRALYSRLLLVTLSSVLGILSYAWLSPASPTPESVTHLTGHIAGLPATIGSWQMVHSHELAAPVRTMLACEAFTSRTYRHQETGSRVNVAIVVGPPGPTAAHEPAACYAARYERLSPQRLELAQVTDGAHGGRLWLQRMRADDTEQLCVLYGWSDGSDWSAPRHARLGFTRHPLLAKVQISASAYSQPCALQTCETFLREILPCLDRHVVKPLQTANRCS